MVHKLISIILSANEMIFSRLQRAKRTIHHGPFIYLVTFCNQEKILDPSLKKVIKYFVVSLDIKFRCNVMYVCFRGRQIF